MVEPEERYWLEDNWGRTRGMLVPLLFQHGVDVFEEAAVGQITEETWRPFLRTTAEALMNRSHGAGSSAAMYKVSLSLFGEPEPLRREIQQAGAKLIGDKAGGVRRAVLKRGLVNMRRSRAADSEHRAKTWSRLDAISRRLHREQALRSGPGSYNRCNQDHFQALRDHLKVELADDRNLPRTVKTIEHFFEEFCADCEMAAQEDIPGLDVGEDNIGVLPQAVRAREYVALCAEALDEDHRRVIEAKFGLGEVIEISTAAFCKREGMDPRRFRRLLDEALAMVAACLDGKLEEDIQ